MKIVKSGFLLFEIAVIISLFSLTSLLLSGWYCRIIDGYVLSKKRFEALLIGTTFIEQLRLYDFNNKRTYKVKDFVLSYSVTNDDNIKNYKHIKVRVYWYEGKNRHEIDFRTGF